ncbi:MAG: hypothetical protein IT276_11795 [Ignavibacteriaceae bacterium]|nr:hypothetical protein [Ignavibacterium sp.]MCC6255590.1 hypothetical protein [Ignavibacteriaceae bacterium]HRN27095.1 hypothetical protein [Ignavibacteriaceae bacterium]HRP91463.1 hypothetical protein [Ignavibacteriaceae bacterium]HRQ54777.1 hypothetical protein [Ignavibacteriaceae bacterium]
MTNHIQKSTDTIKLQVDVLIIKEEDYIVAYCPALELSSYGKTKSEAKAAFEVDIKIFIDETFKSGNLEKYLLKQGWTLQQIPELDYQPPHIPLSITNKAINVISHNIALPIS